MTAVVGLASPLRLPGAIPGAASVLPAADLRARLEELSFRRFNGRIELRAGLCLAELLMREGELVAAALTEPQRAEPLQGQATLNSVFERTQAEWSYRVEQLEPRQLSALAGLGTDPEVCELQNVAELRALLRDLAQHGQEGVLELSDGPRWGRTLVAGGWVFGAYSDAETGLVPSLAPLGELLVGKLPTVRWYPASAAPQLELPRPPQVEISASTTELERLVIWSVSRFEGSWGRARENGPNLDALRDALAQMLDALHSLAIALESANGDGAALEARLSALELETAPPRPLPLLDARLIGLAPVAACPLLVELVVAALQRIVRACPEPTVAECCRQAAQALAAELQPTATARAAAPQNGGS